MSYDIEKFNEFDTKLHKLQRREFQVPDGDIIITKRDYNILLSAIQFVDLNSSLTQNLENWAIGLSDVKKKIMQMQLKYPSGFSL
jgi:hypothetical protein